FVPDPHDVAIVDPAGGGVVGMEPSRFAIGDARVAAGPAVVPLGVEPGPGLVGDEVELAGSGNPQPLRRRQPGRMRRAALRLGGRGGRAGGGPRRAGAAAAAPGAGGRRGAVGGGVGGGGGGGGGPGPPPTPAAGGGRAGGGAAAPGGATSAGGALRSPNGLG